jgi:hypothetical protein
MQRVADVSDVSVQRKLSRWELADLTLRWTAKLVVTRADGSPKETLGWCAVVRRERFVFVPARATVRVELPFWPSPVRFRWELICSSAVYVSAIGVVAMQVDDGQYERKQDLLVVTRDGSIGAQSGVADVPADCALVLWIRRCNLWEESCPR